MRNQPYETGTFERNGRTYHFALYYDHDMGPPWEEHDSHGTVTKWLSSDQSKRPGWRPLHKDGHSVRYYDWQETTAIAKRDAWGLGDEHMAMLTKLLGRAPTRGEIVRAAVQRDFEYLQSWCRDEWHWCWILVEHDESGIYETLGGIESDDEEYIKSTCNDLADQIATQLDAQMAAEITASRPDMQPEFRP